MVTRAQVLVEAREWIGTRYQHQAHQKRVATDCGGLVYGVGAKLGLFPRDVSQIPESPSFVGYARQARNGSLMRACELLMTEIPFEMAQPGDVFLMKFDGEPQHVGFFGAYQYGGFSLIHSYANARKVVESRMDEQWRSRIIATFVLPGVE
jgi:NlpC/P60 family putative phage cell wall peptidase